MHYLMPNQAYVEYKPTAKGTHSMRQNPLAVTVWLLICCGMIFVMALLGAITRLTESGLSITEWNPVMGILPPLNAAAWQQAFAGYQEIPQYQLLHRGMTLEAFKEIYFWEWLHRLWGRLIGIAFAVPLIVFLVQKKISREAGFKFAVIFALGALQGFIGWFMVQSGLEVRTSVSPYRLALHLGFALVIYAILLWTAVDGTGDAPKTKTPPALLRHGWVALGLLALTMVWGAFVAGLHAGEVFNTWPLMEGEFVPTGATTLQPLWHNFFENTALAQFIHRWLGPCTMIVLLAWVARCWRAVDAGRKPGLAALAAMAILQVSLGIGTLLSHAEIRLAVLHQAGAITLLSLLLFNLQRLSSVTTKPHK
jgi:cytochrome c oxidase assembly protein subunit 15